MRKAVLVMDMPSSCDKCPLFGSHYSDMTCEANGRCINYPYPKNIRQDFCPLRELPKKKSVYTNGYYSDGYNACIDELLKGEKG